MSRKTVLSKNFLKGYGQNHTETVLSNNQLTN